MATYPLKNISIGGDTYEIQAGNIGTAYYNIDITSYDSPDTWNHTGLTWNHIIKVWTDGTPQNVTFADLYADEELHSWDLPIFVSLQVTSVGRGMWPCSVLGKTSGSYTIVADGVYNDTACYITITANTTSISSAYGETLSSGGGSEVIRLSLRNQSNAAMAFAALSDSAVFKLYDGSIYWDVTRLNAATMAGHTIAIVDSNNATAYLFYNDTAASFFSFDYIGGGAWSPSRMCVVAEGSSNTFTVRSRKMVPLS